MAPGAPGKDYRKDPPSVDCDILDKLIHHMSYNELRVPPEEVRLLLTEDIFISLKEREKITCLLFDEFNYEAVSYVPQELVSMIGNGDVSSLVVHIGHSYTSVVPIFKMNILRKYAQVTPMGGRDVTATLKEVLLVRGTTNLYRNSDLTDNIVEDMVGKHSQVADSEKEAMEGEVKEVDYELPDGQTVKIGRERLLCTEIHFNPSLIGRSHPGLVDIISSVADSLRRDLPPSEVSAILNRTIFTGAGTMPRNMNERVKKELLRCGWEEGWKVVAPPERKCIAWIGCSIAADVDGMVGWTTKEEYAEHGPSIVHSRCY